MKCELIHSCGSDRLILIFAGWSTSAGFYAEVAVEGYDVMVAYDYSDFCFPAKMLDAYSTICLFAWSLGVYAASRSLPFDKIALAVAVNGTEHPADDSYGIPRDIFKGTAEGLDERNLMKFRRRMTGCHYQSLAERFGESHVDSLRKQLLFVAAEAETDTPPGRWDCAYISSGDAIFPFANQLNFWHSFHRHTEIREISGPHYIDMAALVAGIVSERATVGEKFRKALPSYDDHADAQKQIARDLVGMIPQQQYKRVLEIGPGSGLLTGLFTGKYAPEEMDFIDLYELPRFNAAPVETYHVGDAEEILGQLADSGYGAYDAIISASSIQWFVNHERFFSNVRRLLKDGGVLACSTFTSGNLHELMEVNPFCLVYRNAERLRDMASTGFSETVCRGGEITVEFANARELMLHLQKTGVGGGSKSGLPLSETLRRLPRSLTYKPFYIISRR